MCDEICFVLTKKFYLREIIFRKPSESLTCIPYHKNLSSKWFCKKFPGFSKICDSSGFDRLNLFFDRSKRKRKNPVLRLKLSSCLNYFLIPLHQLNLFLHVFLFLSRFLSTNRKSYLKKKKELDHSSLELCPLLLQFLSQSLLTNFFFFLSFMSQSLKVFFLNIK